MIIQKLAIDVSVTKENSCLLIHKLDELQRTVNVTGTKAGIGYILPVHDLNEYQRLQDKLEDKKFHEEMVCIIFDMLL